LVAKIATRARKFSNLILKMATILIYAGVKGYKKYQMKRANSSAEHGKSKKNRKSISSLIAPKVGSAHIFPASEETVDNSQLPGYDEKAPADLPKYTAPYSPDSIGAPTRTGPPLPGMLGLTLCESPTSPTCELYGDSPIEFRNSSLCELQGDAPTDGSSEVFELAGDESFPDALSPPPLHVVKGGSSPLPPLDEGLDMTYSSDESEEDYEERHAMGRSTYLEIPKSADELFDFEPPRIPRKSLERRSTVV
jgi:hypothetical protein